MKLPNQSPPISRALISNIAPSSFSVVPQIQECFSGAKCTGKVLSNRDYHNCCTKSSGTSWRGRDGKCKRC